MKKHFLLSILMLVGTTGYLNAQKWSAGYRTGISQRNTNLDEHDFDRSNLLWNNQLFIARKLGKRFELELTANYSYHRDRFNIYYLDVPGDVNFDVTQHRITAGLSARYYFLKTKGLDTYGQFGFTSEKAFSHSNVKSDLGFETYKEDGLSLVSTLFVGVGTHYNISETFFLSANLNVYYKPSQVSFFGDHYTILSDWNTGLFVGAGFRF